MTNDKTDVETRLASLETQFAALTDKVKSLSAATGKRKQTGVEKQARKLKLLEAGPYTKESIAKLNNREVKMLASAMEINTFAKSRVEAVQLILEKQKAQTKKKVQTKQGKKEAKK